MSAKKNNADAPRAYCEAKLEVKALLAKLDTALMLHETAAMRSITGLHYGHLGDLNHVKDSLEEILAFVRSGT